MPVKMHSRGWQPTEYHGSVGVGFEGWMKDVSSASLLLAMSKQLLAMAKPRAVMIVRCKMHADSAHTSPIITISLPHSEEGHHIKALQWLVFPQWSVLALGTSQGSLLFYSTRGSLLLRQVFYGSPVLQLRVRGDRSLEELSVIYSSAIVRIDTTDLQPFLHRCLHDAEVGTRKGRFSAVTETYYSTQRVAYQVWNIGKNTGRASSCVDGVVSGIIALPLFECRQLKQRHFCAITVGPNYVYAVHRLTDEKSSSLTNFIMKKILPTAWSTYATLTRIFWKDNSIEQQPPLEAKPQEFGKASLVTALKDEPRKGEKIALSPSGALAALTDSLGRVLLVDTQAFVVIRLWKGYRDARCFFLDVPVDDSGLACPSSRSARSSESKKDFVLCLAIYVPRRGVVEIWKLRNGPRLSIIKCGHGFHVIQPAVPLHGSEINTERNYVPAELFILNGFSGDVAAIRPRACTSTFNAANYSLKEAFHCQFKNVTEI